MKLTIAQNNNNNNNNNSKIKQSNFWDFMPWNYATKSLCHDQKNSRRKIVFRVHDQKQRMLLDAIRIDMDNSFRRLCQQYMGQGKNNQQLAIQNQQLYQFIYEMTDKLKFDYSIGLGYLCTHLYCHIRNKQQRQILVHQFIKKYSIFLKNPNHNSNTLQNRQKYALSQQTLQRTLKYLENNQQTSNRIDINKIDLQGMEKRYQKTLLLQFIPLRYSEYIIHELLKNSTEQYIRLVVSLLHFTINTRNSIDQQHLEYILTNAYMGVIQWPIVIANRHNFTNQID